MHQIIEEKISEIKRFLKTDLSSIQYLDDIELSENSYKSLLYPTDDLFLYKHQYDSIMALAKENDRIFMFQVDDLETIYDVSKPFEYESYREINLYSISVIFPESVDWLVIIDEELDFGIGVFVSSSDKKAEYEKAYSEHYNDLLIFIKSELNNPRKKGSDYFHLNNVISILQTKKSERCLSSVRKEKCSYETLKENFIAYVLATGKTDYGDIASVRRSNRAVDAYRKCAKVIGEEYPEKILDFAELLNSAEQQVRICSAVCLVELMNSQIEIRENAIQTVKKELSQLNDVDRFGFESWLRKYE